MAYLEIETSEGEHRVSLIRERLSIGRLSYNDVALASPQISRQHAELRRIDGAWWIADLNSTNGLHLQGRRIQEHRLSNGDQVVLAPNISLRFVEESGDTESAGQPSGTSNHPGAAGVPVAGLSAKEVRPAIRTAGFTATEASEQSKTHPVGGTFPASGQVYPPLAPAGPMLPEKPRSIYADDEVPYVPSGMTPPQPLARPAGYAPATPAASPVQSHDQATIPFSSWSAGNASMPDPDRDKRLSGGDGYRLPPGPLQPGPATYDPYRRSGTAGDINGSTGLGSGNLLHVCQTCGQLTSPDSVYCQNCHHSIATECSNCRLNLLPIQDRCPRCHTPNEASVRHAHPGR
ncbi:MAG: FHA domain-containing protein [Ktedonobacterales bacterium]